VLRKFKFANLPSTRPPLTLKKLVKGFSLRIYTNIAVWLEALLTLFIGAKASTSRPLRYLVTEDIEICTGTYIDNQEPFPRLPAHMVD
jgi:hypothetical protein